MHTVCVHNANVEKENEKEIQYCLKTIAILYTTTRETIKTAIPLSEHKKISHMNYI